MSDDSKETERQRKAREFEEKASDPQSGIVAEFVEFLLYNKKWWLLPIIFVLLAIGILVVLGGTGAAPFIYTIF